MSRRANIAHFEIAALFAAAVAHEAEELDLVSFASGSERIPFRSTQSVLRTIEKVASRIGAVGHGTNLGRAIREHYQSHDRVLGSADPWPDPGAGCAVTVYVFNTGGYAHTPLRVGDKGRYELGGFSDATFRLMAILEDLQVAVWPF